jgi:hypothetical protein
MEIICLFKEAEQKVQVMEINKDIFGFHDQERAINNVHRFHLLLS